MLWAQNLLEYSRVLDGISIALCKGKNSDLAGHKLTASSVTNSVNLNDLMQSDLGFRFMSQVRGSPAYWQKTKSDVLAMVR